MDLQADLPALLPKAIAWAETEAGVVAGSGRALTAVEQAMARKVGVKHPERVRVVFVDKFPMPQDATLQAATLQTGLLGSNTGGLTLGYSVFVRRGHATWRLLSHEFRHVHQYERAGSIAAFLPMYLQQIARYGYATAPLELDARAHEQQRP